MYHKILTTTFVGSILTIRKSRKLGGKPKSRRKKEWINIWMDVPYEITVIAQIVVT